MKRLKLFFYAESMGLISTDEQSSLISIAWHCGINPADVAFLGSIFLYKNLVTMPGDLPWS